MKSRVDTAIELLHVASEAALATLSATLAGYPFATLIPFVPDEHHRPVFLISSLAEHSRNLAADRHASLLVARPLGDGEIARVTLVGKVRPIEPSPAMLDRYLRYQPAAERFLQLGDFAFQRLDPERIYVVGGFAQAGWLEQQRLIDLPCVTPEVELGILDAARSALPASCRLLGIDAHGVDLDKDGMRLRLGFTTGPLTGDALLPGIRRLLAEAGLQSNQTA